MSAPPRLVQALIFLDIAISLLDIKYILSSINILWWTANGFPPFPMGKEANFCALQNGLLVNQFYTQLPSLSILVFWQYKYTDHGANFKLPQLNNWITQDLSAGPSTSVPNSWRAVYADLSCWHAMLMSSLFWDVLVIQVHVFQDTRHEYAFVHAVWNICPEHCLFTAPTTIKRRLILPSSC